MRMALEQAIRWGMIQHNPAQQVDLPRKRREELSPLSPEEARRFLSVAEDNRHGVLFELMLTTGLRPGETLGLKWGDIDLENERLRVQRTLVPSSGFEEPKTPQARRTIPLLQSTVQALRRHRKQQAEEKLRAGPEYQDRELVFAGDVGQPLEHRNLVRRYFKPLLREAGLPETLRLYDLRHTCATLLLAAGGNPKIVSERLGHASVTMTLDTYSHVLPDMQQSAVKRLNALLYPADQK